MSKKKNKLPFQQKTEELQREKPFTLCFEFCDEKELPHSKNDTKIVIEALKSFSNIQTYQNRNPHKLNLSGESKYIQSLNKKYSQDIYSIDAGKRGGEQGGKRIIFYKDQTRKNVIKILSLFFDDHGKR